MSPKAVSCAIAFALLGLTPAGFGSIIFDPDGSGALPTYQVESVDFMQGNALAQGMIATPDSFTQYYQARLDALVGPDGNQYAVPGLNVPGGFQITAITGFTASGSWSGKNFNADQTAGKSFFQLYYSPVFTANDLAGTGFTDGTLIYSGTVADATIGFTKSLTATGANKTDLLDRFGTDDYAGKRTLVGGGFLTFSSVPDYVNSDFFLTAPSAIALEFTSSSITPFRQIDPSHLFTDVSDQGQASTVTPDLGGATGVNGVNGTDFQTQADGNAAFVPEPATLGLLAGAALLLMPRRARKN